MEKEEFERFNKIKEFEKFKEDLNKLVNQYTGFDKTNSSKLVASEDLKNNLQIFLIGAIGVVDVDKENHEIKMNADIFIMNSCSSFFVKSNKNLLLKKLIDYELSKIENEKNPR